MKWNNYFRSLEITHRIEITQELRDAIKEHFGSNLSIYTEQDMYEQSRKVIQNYKYKHK